MEAKRGGVPDDHDAFLCRTAGGGAGQVLVYRTGGEVVILAPPGEAIILSPSAADAIGRAVSHRAGAAAVYARRPVPPKPAPQPHPGADDGATPPNCPQAPGAGAGAAVNPVSPAGDDRGAHTPEPAAGTDRPPETFAPAAPSTPSTSPGTDHDRT